MNIVKLTAFFDGCPTDWLQDSQDERWHTLAYLAIPTEIPFLKVVQEIEAVLPNKCLKKWGGGRKHRYRRKFAETMSRLWPSLGVWFNAISFKEKNLRTAKPVLVKELDMGFLERTGPKGRIWMQHQFVDFDGFHLIDLPENKMLVLLAMAWVTITQYLFYKNLARTDGYDDLVLILISDNLSGDNDIKRFIEQALHNVINPARYLPLNIYLTSSLQNAQQHGDFLVDNLAGWLNECINSPTGEFSRLLYSIPDIENLIAWYEFTPSDGMIKLNPILPWIKEEPNVEAYGAA